MSNKAMSELRLSEAICQDADRADAVTRTEFYTFRLFTSSAVCALSTMPTRCALNDDPEADMRRGAGIHRRWSAEFRTLAH
jgi:hypothetical protein